MTENDNFAERQVVGFIETFIVKSRRERYYVLAPNHKSRKKALDRLNHKIVGDLRENVEHDVPPAGLDMDQATYIVSDSSDLDDAVMPLSEAIALQEQSSFGTLVLARGGKLAIMRCESPSGTTWLYH